MHSEQAGAAGHAGPTMASLAGFADSEVCIVMSMIRDSRISLAQSVLAPKTVYVRTNFQLSGGSRCHGDVEPRCVAVRGHCLALWTGICFGSRHSEVKMLMK
eukprot:12753-Amphidinium_carterae.1